MRFRCFTTLKKNSRYLAVHISATSTTALQARRTQSEAETTAILPALGADLVVNFTDRLSLGAELQFFVSDVNKYSGNLIDFGLSGHYHWLEWLTIGAGYRFYRQDIDSADEDFFGDYRFEYRGPFVFLNVRL